MNQSIKLEEIWKVETEILDEITRVCDENGLRYSLAYGTLLGAIRHKGFIPWDDDIDIMMPREDYERLREIWKEKSAPGYLYEDETMFADYVNTFAKVRKDHTTFLQYESERTCDHHTGLFVDIMPGDRVAPGGFRQKLQYADFALKLLYNRSYTSGAKGVRGAAEKLLLRVIPKRFHMRVSNYFGRRSRRWNGNKNAQYVFSNSIAGTKRFYPSDMFDNLIRVSFEGKEYNAINKYDEYLRINYGDYMELPPVEERVWTHHPIIISYDKNYDELELEKKN